MNKIPQLKKVERLDSIPLDQTYFTEEGYLLDHPIVTSIGIFEYQNPDGSIRRELRRPEEVFNPESLLSYKGKPIIVTHDAGMVTKDNVDEEMIGAILSPGHQDGEVVRAEIVIHSTDSLRCGLRELSLGYSLDLDETPGQWNGQPYDAAQQNIRINHLALVKNARAGETARLNVDGRDKDTAKSQTQSQNQSQNQKGMNQQMKAKTRRADEAQLTPEETQEAIKLYQEAKAKNTATDGEEGLPPILPPATPGKEAETTPPEATPEQTIQTVKENKDRRDAEGAEVTGEEKIKQMDADISSLLAAIEQLLAAKEFDEADPDSAEKKNEDEDETKASGKAGDNPAKNKDGSEDKSGALNMDEAERLFGQKLELVRLGDRLNLDGLDKLSVLDGKKAIIKKLRPALRLDGKGGAYIQAAFDLAKEELSKRKDVSYQRCQMFNSDGRDRRTDTGTSAAELARQKMIENQMNGGNK